MALIAGSLVAGTSVYSFASDWDKAGKALAIIEGIRIVTGGKADIIGTITGINRPGQEVRESRYSREPDQQRYADNYHGRFKYERNERVWVPHYVWEERYIPRHTEYRPGYGEVVIEAHHERYQVEEGGHWEIKGDCGQREHRSQSGARRF